MTDGFPLGAAALHPGWPDARFNLSGMFTHHPLIIQLMYLVEQGFKLRLPIEAVHGAPAVCWNAGRPMRVPFKVDELRSILRAFHSRDVGYFATFTNHLLQENDLADRVGNELLEIINERPDLNGVIITSELLSSYIAKRYPAIRQIASITKVAIEGGVGRVGYYQELGRRFDRYVIHSDDCCDLALLEKLDPAKAEIIVNENCVRGCPTRPRHFTAYARWQKASTAPEREAVQQELKAITAVCQIPMKPAQLQAHRPSCNLTVDEMKAVYAMGYRRFKLQGRTDDAYAYAYDLTRFMLEPGLAAPLTYKRLVDFLQLALAQTA